MFRSIRRFYRIAITPWLVTAVFGWLLFKGLVNAEYSWIGFGDRIVPAVYRGIDDRIEGFVGSFFEGALGSDEADKFRWLIIIAGLAAFAVYERDNPILPQRRHDDPLNLRGKL